MKKTAHASRVPPEEVLSFMLGSQEYGIDMRQVEEICGFDSFARDASRLDLDNGVANLRGMCVPVIDMRIRFALGTPAFDESTSVIIVKLGESVMILVVDGISDVHRLDSGKFKAPPRSKGSAFADCLLGLGMFGGHRVMLIAVDRLMPSAAAPHLHEQLDTSPC